LTACRITAQCLGLIQLAAGKLIRIIQINCHQATTNGCITAQTSCTAAYYFS